MTFQTKFQSPQPPKLIKFEVTVLLKTRCYTVDMSTSATEVADFIQQFVKQQEGYQGACFSLTGEKGYHSVESGARHHFIIGLIIDLDDKKVQMEITKGHYIQALAPLHRYVLDGNLHGTHHTSTCMYIRTTILDALGFEKGRGPVFNYEDTDAVILHSKLAAAVIDTMLSMQKAMSASRLRTR